MTSITSSIGSGGPAAEGSAGSGLGLAIAKDLVEAHGGLLSVDSPPGRGSTFWFNMPVVESEA